MKRLGILVAGIALIAVTLYAWRGPLSMALMSRAMGNLMDPDPLAQFEDGIHVRLCGAGSPLPDPQRSGPCTAIYAGGQLFVVDAGNGARNLTRDMQPQFVDAVFLTHFHSDHIDGLGQLMTLRWAGAGGARSAPLQVVGPTGVERVVDGFNEAYALDFVYRIDHHGADILVPSAAGLSASSFPKPSPGAELTVYEKGGVQVRMFAVDHTPIDPAVGYRFDYGGRSVVISGDTVKSDEIERMSKDVDLLVHEALAPHLVEIMTRGATEAGMTARAKITTDILDYHASPIDAAETARDAGVGHLLYHHIVPPLIVPGMEAAFLRGVPDVFDAVTVGKDGTHVFLPKDSDAIEISGG